MITNSDNTESLAIVGMGYVGLPLCLAFAEKSIVSYGIDIDSKKISKLQNGESYINYIDSSRIQKAIGNSHFIPTCNFNIITSVNTVIICVPTPLASNREPDLSYIENAIKDISPYLRKNQLVVLESTTYPGTTETIVKHNIENLTALKAGIDFYLAFSPERENPGGNTELHKIPKIIGGLTKECRDKTISIYSKIIDTIIPVSDTKTAEAVKLTENIFRSINIALVNELKIIYSQMNMNIWEIIDAASTKPFGFMPFYPGPGVGGHCIPIDPIYLSWKAKKCGVETRLITAADEINRSMPHYVVQKVLSVLDTEKIPINKSKILLLGVAYKADIGDDRGSPTYEIMSLLKKEGADLDYNDPHIPQIGSHINDFAGKKSVNVFSGYDLILLCTNHKEYSRIDFDTINTPIVDCRNFIKVKSKYYLA